MLAGPVEATALGNVLVQARAAGELGSLAELRAVAAASVSPDRHEPSADRDAAEATYRRFLDLTGTEPRAREDTVTDPYSGLAASSPTGVTRRGRDPPATS